MPPVSRPPRGARGEGWALMMATRRIVPASKKPRRTRLSSLDKAAIDLEVLAAQVVLVGLAAAQEIEAVLAPLDGVAQQKGLGEKPYRQVCVVRVVTAVVEGQLVAAVEAEHGGDAATVPLHHAETDHTSPGQRRCHAPEERLHLLTHEVRLVLAAVPVHPEEVVEARRYFLRRPPEL